MSAVNPAGNAWLEKLEEWLRHNQHPDIIYAVAVAHRDGFASMVSNVSEEHAKDFLSKFLKETQKESVYSSATRVE